MKKINDALPKKYLDLVEKYPLICIKSKKEEKAAQNLINSLVDLEESEGLTKEQESYLDALTELLSAYQRRVSFVPDIHGVGLLKSLIKERQMRQKQLVFIFKTESIVSAILNGKRNLTVEHIEKLADYFKCSPAAFFPRGDPTN